jgi:hypothetical protein
VDSGSGTQKRLQLGLRPGVGGSRGRGSAGNSGEGPANPFPGSLGVRGVLHVEKVLGCLFLHLEGGVLDAVAVSEE